MMDDEAKTSTMPQDDDELLLLEEEAKLAERRERPNNAQQQEQQQQSAIRSMESAHKTLSVLRCKVLFVGGPHVGKTSLCQVFQSAGQNFPKSYLMVRPLASPCLALFTVGLQRDFILTERVRPPSTHALSHIQTLGVDFTVKEVAVKAGDAARMVEMFVYDTGGQSVFNQRELGGQYWTNASVAVYVYDVGDRESFLSCSKWLSSVRSENAGRPVPGVLVANKTDLREKGRVRVSRDEGKAFAKDNGLTFLETSALRNSGVTELFQFVADAFSAKYDEATASANNAA